MKRNLKEYIREYENRFEAKATGHTLILASDIQQIHDMCRTQEAGTERELGQIINALKAGYMVGYKACEENR